MSSVSFFWGGGGGGRERKVNRIALNSIQVLKNKPRKRNSIEFRFIDVGTRNEIPCSSICARLIQEKKPASVVVELCRERSSLLQELGRVSRPRDSEISGDEKSEKGISWSLRDLFEIFKESRNNPNSNAFGVIYSRLLKQIGEELDIVPGEKSFPCYRPSFYVSD